MKKKVMIPIFVAVVLILGAFGSVAIAAPPGTPVDDWAVIKADVAEILERLGISDGKIDDIQGDIAEIQDSLGVAKIPWQMVREFDEESTSAQLEITRVDGPGYLNHIWLEVRPWYLSGSVDITVDDNPVQHIVVPPVWYDSHYYPFDPMYESVPAFCAVPLNVRYNSTLTVDYDTSYYPAVFDIQMRVTGSTDVAP
jgi:hypothetical protein